MKKIYLLLPFIIIFIANGAEATEVKEIKTKNSFNVWLVEEHSNPIISVNIAFRNSGSSYDPDGKEGLIKLAGSMLTEGAGNMNSESFTNSLEEKAIKLSFSAGDDNFYANLNTLSEYKQQAFYYLGLALSKPRFDKKPLDRLKRQIISLIKENEKKPYYLLDREWKKQIFGSHPYAKPDYGYQNTVKSISKKDLKNFTSNYLTKENIIISVVGDITEQELVELIDKNLNNLPKKYSSAIKIKDISVQKGAKQTIIDKDIPQTIILFSMEGIKRNSPDYIDAYVMNYILGGGTLTSRLNDNLRAKKGLTYSISSDLSPMNHAAVFGGGFATRNDKAKEAVSILKETIKQMVENGVTEKEIRDAKKFLIGSFMVKLDSNSSIVNFLTMMQLHNLGIDYMNRRNKLINEVTVEKANNIAKKLIKTDKLQIVMIGKPKFDGEVKP
ncbi:MAG: pitrilysin family protein [Rickettsiales bacterium]